MPNSNFEIVVRQEVEKAKQQVRLQFEQIMKQVYDEAERLLSQPSLRHSEITLGVKTGRLRRSLKFTLEQIEDGIFVKMWFDLNVAPHAKFVIQGTRRIKPHPVFEQALSKVLGDEYLLGG